MKIMTLNSLNNSCFYFFTCYSYIILCNDYLNNNMHISCLINTANCPVFIRLHIPQTPINANKGYFITENQISSIYHYQNPQKHYTESASPVQTITARIMKNKLECLIRRRSMVSGGVS